MKQHDNYKEAVNTVFIEEKSKKLLKEAGASYVPTGLSVRTSDPVKDRNRMPPYSSHAGNSDDGMLGIEMQPDDMTDAPPQLPYPLETVLDHLADGYSGVNTANGQIKIALDNPLLTKIQIEKMKKLQAELKLAMENIKRVASEIQRITLD